MLMCRLCVLVCSVLLTSCSSSCAISPQRLKDTEKGESGLFDQTFVRHEQFGPSKPEMFTLDRTKREAARCQEAEHSEGINEIINSNKETYNFFISPQLGFKWLRLRMKIDNKLDFSSFRHSREYVEFNRAQLNLTDFTWIPIKVNYFKKVVALRGDKHALRVTVGETLSEDMITSYWWRIYSYEGFVVYADGPIKVRFNCFPTQTLASSSVDKDDASLTTQNLVLVCVIGILFLLVVAAGIIYLFSTRHPMHTRLDSPPPVPKLPESMHLRRYNHQKDSCENIYEDMKEDDLAEIRRKLDPETLAAGIGNTNKKPKKDGQLNSYEDSEALRNMKSNNLNSATGEWYHMGQYSNPMVKPFALSLLQEKEAWRQGDEPISPQESHYVDMHSILSRTSSLSK